MKIYITFGQDHIHDVDGTLFDKDTVAEIDCNSYNQGRKTAFKLFGDQFATSYTKDEIEKSLHYFPNGIINVNS